MSDRKKLVAFAHMPERLTREGIIANMHADVTDTTSQLRRTLTDKALTMSAQLYVLDDDSWEFAHNGRTIVGSVVVTR